MENSKSDEDFEELLKSLPKEKSIASDLWSLYCFQGFWYPEFVLKSVVLFQKQFVALDDDLFLASCPKSGTTWLKALAFTIVNRGRFPLSETPLISASPHALVPFAELVDEPDEDALNKIPNPRLLSTHVPYSLLPASIRDSGCKIVYICRNPMDQFVSSWYFSSGSPGENPVSITEESFDRFCRGVFPTGPFWDHVLEFWKASLENPRKILFVRYEDLKKDAVFHVKRLAAFLGFAFSEEEEKQGLVEEIVKFCSIENMKTLTGNVHGKRPVTGIPHSSFFRKGEVGDWVNHLTPSMAERLGKIIQEKYGPSSLEMV